MSDPTPFNIHDFDGTMLDAAALVQAVTAGEAIEGWTVESISPSLYRLLPADSTTYPMLAIQRKANAIRQGRILEGLFNLGVRVAPRPFYADEQWLVREWVPGEPLSKPPAVDTEDMWHRIMALLGTPAHLSFAQHASVIAMTGNGPQNPGDVIQHLDSVLASLDPNNPRLNDLTALVERVHQQVAPQWNYLPPIALSHLDPLPRHFIWDGKYLRLVGWDAADWADSAYGAGQLCAHPVYEDVPASHWVWYRWELARLNHEDEGISARATTYTNLMLVYWAMLAPNPKQQERYYRRALRAFA